MKWGEKIFLPVPHHYLTTCLPVPDHVIYAYPYHEGTTYHTTKISSSQYAILNREIPLARLGDDW